MAAEPRRLASSSSRCTTLACDVRSASCDLRRADAGVPEPIATSAWMPTTCWAAATKSSARPCLATTTGSSPTTMATIDLVVGDQLGGRAQVSRVGEVELDVEAVGHRLELRRQLGRAADDGDVVARAGPRRAPPAPRPRPSTRPGRAPRRSRTVRRRVVSRSSRPATRRRPRRSAHGDLGLVGPSPAAARNSSERLGDSTPKSCTGMRARTLSSTAPGSAPGSRRRRVPEASRDATVASAGVDPGVVDGDVDAQVALRAARLQGADLTVEHHPAVVDEGDRLAEVLDEVELVAGEEQVPSRAARGRGSRRRGTRRRWGRGQRTARRARAPRGRGPSRRPAAPAGPCRRRGPAPCRWRGRPGRAARAGRRPARAPVALSRPCSRAIQVSRSSTRISR